MKSIEGSRTKLEAALEYATEGWPVLPLHSTHEGRCTCNKETCSRGKHPRTRKGIHDATTESAFSSPPPLRVGPHLLRNGHASLSRISCP